MSEQGSEPEPPRAGPDESGVRPTPVGGARPLPDTLVDPLPGEPTSVAEPQDARIGTVVAGRWALMYELGRGSAGAIYEACHVLDGGRVAVKVLHDTARASHEAKVRFVREAHTAASIEHPHIVRIIETGRDADGSLYQVQELLEGEDLGAALARGPLSVREAVEIGCQMLDALAAVHDHGFVHRDVKPENVFLTREADGAVHAKLLDFGIAKHLFPEDGLRAITLDGVVLGTPYYMSPEQVTGESLTVQADLWALGAVLFHALSGRRPFDDAQLFRLIAQITCEPAPSLLGSRPELPPNVVEAVDRALMREPSRRWADARQMAVALAGGARPAHAGGA